jgi:hypothetical protein
MLTVLGTLSIPRRHDGSVRPFRCDGSGVKDTRHTPAGRFGRAGIGLVWKEPDASMRIDTGNVWCDLLTRAVFGPRLFFNEKRHPRIIQVLLAPSQLCIGTMSAAGRHFFL